MWLLLSIAYLLLLFLYRHGWRQTPVTEEKTKGLVRASILVPIRNEEKNIEPLLRSIVDQISEKDDVEILVIDDHSSDRGPLLAASFPYVRVLALEETKGKKAALLRGINEAKHENILCTDADCIVGPNWLRAKCAVLEESDLVSGPVRLVAEKPSFLASLQAFEFAGLNAIGASQIQLGFPGLANGANLSFRRSAFIDVGGYAGIDSVASGDDDLLLQKFSKQGKALSFLKDPSAMVQSNVQASFLALLAQRRRWASKSRHYPDKRIVVQQVFVFAFYLSIIVYAFLFFLGYQESLYPVLNMLFTKILAEWLFYSSIVKFYNIKHSLIKLIVGQIPQLLYVLLIGVLSQFGRYEWKGRKSN